MRKGYGPTGVSFGYNFSNFQRDLAQCKQINVEVVMEGNTFTAYFSTDMTESEARVLFDKFDNLSLHNGNRLYQMFT